MAINIMKKSNIILNLYEKGIFSHDILEKGLLNDIEIKIINVKTKVDIKKIKKMQM